MRALRGRLDRLEKRAGMDGRFARAWEDIRTLRAVIGRMRLRRAGENPPLPNLLVWDGDAPPRKHPAASLREHMCALALEDDDDDEPYEPSEPPMLGDQCVVCADESKDLETWNIPEQIG